MIKTICKQLWNRKRSHVWIMVELLCVFCLIWYMVDYFFVYGYNKSIPDHRSAAHTWQVNLAVYPSDHPDYAAEEDSAEAAYANYVRILQTLRNYPGVEAVSVAAGNSRLWSGNFTGGTFFPLSDTLRQANGQLFSPCPDGDFFRVFGYTSNGKPVSMNDFDWTIPNAMVVSRSAEAQLFPGHSAIGKEVVDWWRQEKHYTIVGVVDDIKRFDYNRPQHAFYSSHSVRADQLDANGVKGLVYAVRSNASISDAVFRDGFTADMADALRIGNFYLLSVQSYADIKQDTARLFGGTTEIRIRTYLMAFFLINMLLCVMGTFWYRINTRRNEIGLLMALGATHKGIRGAFFMEGLILLTFAAMPAMIIESQLVVADLIETMGKDDSMTAMHTVYLPDRKVLRFLITNATTWFIMAVVIIAAIWIPARNASRIPPAEALHYE